MERCRFHRDHRGLSLVELLVAVAILGIALTAITGFMVVGARSFSSTSSEVNLQYESQLAFNQLQDLVVDTQKGLTQTSVTGGTETTVPATDIPADTVDEKRLYIYNESVAYVIKWSRLDSRLFYEEYNVTVNGAGEPVLGSALVTNARMADYITDFDVDISKLEAKSIVGVHMAFQKDRKSYDANYNITLRNKILVNKDMKDTYTEPIPTPSANTIETLSVVVVEPGSKFTFPAPVVKSSVASETPSQEVRWMPDAANPADPGTSISTTGILMVSPSESHDTFRVKVQTPDHLAVSYVDIKVRKVDTVAVKFTPISKDKDGKFIPATALTKNSEFRLDATVTMNFEEELTTGATGDTLEQAKTLEWKIMEGDTYLAGSSPSNYQWDGKMKTVVVDKMPLRVRATASHSKVYAAPDGVYGEWVGETHAEKPNFPITSYGTFERGQEYAFNVVSGSREGYIYLFQVEIRKLIYNDEGVVTGYTVVDANSIIDRSEHGNNVKIKFPMDLDPYDEYEVDIRCYEFPYGVSGKVLYGFLSGYGYDISKATGESWTDTIPLHASDVYFDNVDTIKKNYTPRKYCINLNGTDDTMFTVGGISHFRMADGFNLNRDSIKWYFYTNLSGKNSESAFTRYYNTSMFNCWQEGASVKIQFTRSQWQNSLPSELYLVPTIIVNGKEYMMWHSYVKFINHNITVTKDGTSQKLFFPYPKSGADGITDFPGRDDSSYTKNLGTGIMEMKGSWYYAYNFSETLQYDLSYYIETSTGLKNYTLVLRNSDRSKKCGTYKIIEGQKEWIKQ